jgi:hypothetical protein
MGFDLWTMLGVTPAVGIAIVAGGIATAVLLGAGLSWRRSRTSRVVGMGLGQDR